MGALELTAKRQASWSITADKLKSSLDLVRWSTFTLSILGAILATAASQLQQGDTRTWVAAAGACALALATFLTARITAARMAGWVRARAASEALKREAFKFATQAAPYDDAASADDALTKERSKIEDGIDDLIAEYVEADRPSRAPTAAIPPDEYIKRRIRGQIDGFYLPRAERFRRLAKRLRTAEFGLALAATLLTAVVGALKKYPVSDFPFDLAALTALLTTLGAFVLAHIEASRYDFLVTTYLATARRLEEALSQLKAVPAVPSPDWSTFVERCENIIAAENSSWVAKWSGK